MKNTRGSEWNKWDLHIHTASSYDSPYKADDADELLCQALAENDIKAVAITDHFKIDKTRIEHLRKLAPEIVFFPGVELRTDKGANNLHLILIFSELSDLETLSADFNAIMLRTLAKSKESDETIYWQFDDIVEFCKNHGGLISIHAGKKSNGIDKEISNALPVKEAIKSDIAKHNPNIAVACDAEQIICCKMDKNTHKITYLSGAIEDQEIKQNVVDILEGTMPAFDLRRRKYV